MIAYNRISESWKIEKTKFIDWKNRAIKIYKAKKIENEIYENKIKK